MGLVILFSYFYSVFVVTTRILFEMFQTMKVNMKIGDSYKVLNFSGSIQTRGKPKA